MTPRVDPGRVGIHADADICIDLLEDLLPHAERERVLAHLSQCPGCESLLRDQAATRERLRARTPEALRHAPGRLQGSTHSSERSWAATLHRFLAPAVTGRGFAVAGALAAAVLVVVATRVPRVELPRSSRASIAAPEVHWLPGSETDVTTRAPWTNAPDPNVRAGIEAYARHDLREARRLLGSARSEGSLEVLRQLFLGSAAALDHDYATAEDILGGLPMDQIPEPWRSEALWTMYAACESRGAHARADSLLALIAASPGPLAERARNLPRRP